MTDETPAKADASGDETIVEAVPVAPKAVEADSFEPVAAEPVAVDPVTTEPASSETAVADPAAAPVLVEPSTPVPADTAQVQSAVAEPVFVAPAAATAEVAPVAPTAAVPVETAASAAPAQLVYVAAPVPPKTRGNRLIGALLAVVGGIVFTAVFAVVGGLIIDIRDGDLFGPEFITFVSSAFFWVPVSVFLVGLILMVLLLNRAGWWAHVLGSLILAIAVYAGTIGVLLLIGNVFHGSPTPITFQSLAINPWVIATAIVTREVSIWIGLAIAARGRRVKVRNVESRAAFDREQEAKRAEYAGPVAGA